MSRLLLAVLAASLVTTSAATAASPLRIATISATAGPCASLEGSAPAGEQAYYDHLAKRLGVPIQRCPVANAAAAAAALAANQLDVAILDPASFAPVKASTRAILTLRPEGGLNRIALVLGVKANSPITALADLRGKTIAFGGATPAAQATPRKALADRGAGQGYFGAELNLTDEDDAGAALRAGQADAIILHAAAWQRLCPKVAASKPKPCADLKALARFRPVAANAVVVRNDMPLETRYRLIGIHMPLHLENKAAFAWASSFGVKPAEFEPTEALALVGTP